MGASDKMRERIRPALLMLVFFLLGHLLGLVTAWVIVLRSQVQVGVLNLYATPSAQLDLLREAWDFVESDFIGRVPDSRTMTYGAIRGALGTLNDPYTMFVEPQVNQREKEDLQGKFGGIGVTMQRNEAGEVVLSPMQDAPAIRAGVQEGDILTSVAGAPITPTVSFDQIAAMVRGPVGTPVDIEIRRGAPAVFHTFTITRAEIELPSVTWRVLEDAPEVGYIALARFSEPSKDEMVEAIGQLRAQGVTRLILDLRDNGGGLRQAGIEVASQFLPDGVVMYQQKKDKPEESFPVIEGGAAVDMPLVVLVNRGTASASEIVAGALQDRGRARLVGEQTFGKGSVQHIYDLSDGSSLHVTAAEWLTPSRHQLTGQGLTPDIAVARTPEDAAAGRDPQLEAAIQYIKGEK